METNFEGKNIDTPRVSFPKKLLDSGLAFEMVTEVQITLEENVAILTDGYFGDMPPPTNWTQFYQTNNIQSTFYSTQNNLLAEYKFS